MLQVAIKGNSRADKKSRSAIETQSLPVVSLVLSGKTPQVQDCRADAGAELHRMCLIIDRLLKRRAAKELLRLLLLDGEPQRLGHGPERLVRQHERVGDQGVVVVDEVG